MVLRVAYPSGSGVSSSNTNSQLLQMKPLQLAPSSTWMLLFFTTACLLVSTAVARRATQDTVKSSSSTDPVAATSSFQMALASASALLVGGYYYWMSSSTGSSSATNKSSRPLSPASYNKNDADECQKLKLQVAFAKEKMARENDDQPMIWREDGGISKLVPLHPIPQKRIEELKKYTMKEVSKKTTPEEAWIVIDGLVYNITNFVAKHPGGEKVLWAMAGKDCTDAFANYHSASVYQKWLPPFLIGQVTDVPVYPHVQDFREIRQELLRRGLFETSSTFYFQLYTWFASLFLLSLYLSLRCESTMAHMMGAITMGFFWQQLAGWGHDLGHSSVSHNFLHDNLIGATIGCIFMGISTGWWKRSHNTHHVVCNSIEHDPDIQHMPVLAVSPKIIEKPYWSSYHSKVFSMDVASRFFIRHQHLLFFPIMMFARFNLYAQSWILLLTTNNKDSIVMYYRTQEIVCLVIFTGWLLGVAFSMPTYQETIAWIVLSHAFAALLHVQICFSHFSMETYNGKAYNDASDEWYIMQIKTSMNIDCYESMDFFHIGLQYQIEHHLFPTLPRHNLPIAKKMVKDVCRKHGIHYHEETFYQGVKRTVQVLRATALEARSGKYDYQTSTNQLRDLLNANG